jgi:helicase required for RNAi-mediated heterochromatin assembly 1
VQAKSEIEPPSYVQNNPYTDMSSIVTMEECENFQNVHILQDWPSSNSHGLDNSQSRALRRILTKRLAIVQGPPGTGKTYVSVVALKILLANMRKDDPPIIVTCQTNHALDQLLRHVAEFEPNFIRLGGRSKDTNKIRKRTLFEVRSGVSKPKSNNSLKSQAMVDMKKLITEMQMLLAPLEANKPPLDHRALVKLGVMTEVRALTIKYTTYCGLQLSILAIPLISR